MSAEREHEHDLVPDRRTASGHDRQTAREADAHHADPAVGGEVVPATEPADGVFDLVHATGRELILHQIRQLHREHRESTRRELARQASQPRFVDAHCVHARYEQHGSSNLDAGTIEPRSNPSLAGRHRRLRFDRVVLRLRLGGTEQEALDLRRADHERRACARRRVPTPSLRPRQARTREARSARSAVASPHVTLPDR